MLSAEQMQDAARAKEQLTRLREAHGSLRVRVAALEEDGVRAQRELEEARRQVAPLTGQIQ